MDNEFDAKVQWIDSALQAWDAFGKAIAAFNTLHPITSRDTFDLGYLRHNFYDDDTMYDELTRLSKTILSQILSVQEFVSRPKRYEWVKVLAQSFPEGFRFHDDWFEEDPEADEDEE